MGQLEMLFPLMTASLLPLKVATMGLEYRLK